jgi:hypothetical protein
LPRCHADRHSPGSAIQAHFQPALTRHLHRARPPSAARIGIQRRTTTKAFTSSCRHRGSPTAGPGCRAAANPAVNGRLIMPVQPCPPPIPNRTERRRDRPHWAAALRSTASPFS